MRYLIAFLLLCSTALADNLDDLKNWPANGLPVSAEWSVNGHALYWHVDQVEQGRRLIPTTGLPFLKPLTNSKADAKVAAIADELRQISDWRLPLILRDGSQIAVRMVGTAPRLDSEGRPIQDADGYRLQLPESAVQWKLVDGVLNDTPFCDPFAPVGPSWETEARDIARSRYMELVQAAAPNVSRVLYADNNEVGYGKYKQVASYGPIILPGMTKEQIKNAPSVWSWRPNLETISVRMRDWVAANNPTPDQGYAKFYELRGNQYRSYFRAIRSNFAGAWADKELLSYAYAVDSGEYLSYDGHGPSFYPGRYQSANYLASDHDKEIAAAVEEWKRTDAQLRVIFVWAGPKPAMAGAKEGAHEVVSPDIFQALCEWTAWASHEKGKPLLLQHWIEDRTGPNDLFFSTPEIQATLTSLGRADLLGVTHGQYSIAPAKACDSICRPEIRDYWLSGEPITATTSESRVRLQARKKPDGSVMLYGWTPCRLTGHVSVTVPGFDTPFSVEAPAPKAYWIIRKAPGDVAAAEAALAKAQADLEAAKLGGVVVTKVEN